MNKHITPAEYENTRLDRYLRKIYPLLTQGLIERFIRKRVILINGKTCAANDRLHSGDIINTPAHFQQYIKQASAINPKAQVLAEKILNPYLIVDHPKFIAINKPVFLATQGGTKIDLSIDHALQFMNQELVEFKLVHRLDKDTSGLLLIAKGHQSAVKLTQAFKDRIIKKRYLAILSGTPKKLSGIIKSTSAEGERIKEAITEFKILEYNQVKQLSLCLFKPSTGIMHQLRYHATLIGCQIVGDKKYPNPQLPSLNISSTILMLHAYQVTLPSAIFEEDIIITATLPNHYLDFSKKYFNFDYTSI